MIDGMSGASNLLNGVNLEEILRKKLEKDPLEEILNPDPAQLLEQASAGSKDTLTVSAESMEAASMLKEFNTAKDYAKTALETRQMDAEMAMEAKATEFNVLDHMSAEMRDSVLDAAQRGRRKKNDDVYAASEQTVNEAKKDIDRAAEEAATPKDADGNPIELPGQSAARAAATADAAAPAPAPQAASVASAAAAAVDVDVDTPSAVPAAAAPKLNITV